MLWQTALSPMCRHCNVLLVPATAAPAGEVVAASRDLTVPSASSSSWPRLPSLTTARVRLGRFRRLCASSPKPLTTSGPIATTPPTRRRSSRRAWGRLPQRRPATVATIWSARPGLHSTAFHDQLSREATPADAAHRHATTQSTSRNVRRRPTTADRRRLQRHRQRPPALAPHQLEHHGVRHGIRPKHVPALLPHPDDDGLPSPSDWRTRWHRPRAAHAAHPNPRRLTPRPSRNRPRLRHHRHRQQPVAGRRPPRRGISHTDAHLLGDAVTVLLNDGLIDYQRRRDVLRPISMLPRLPVPAGNLPGSTGTRRESWPGLDLDAADPWTYVDQPVPLVPDRHVRAFNAAIDPETRLALHEAGQRSSPTQTHLHPPAARPRPPSPGGTDEPPRAGPRRPAHPRRADRARDGRHPIPAMDATFYAHYAEELRMLVEELLADRPRFPPP